ncbi:hypothetical protein HD596_008896 [Nonomuraea jabiensis]|uniref:Uncharacterized protein n=1 Tax=Nonomuraea jabiensis TaxID=882448 RepID=A0A7W9LFQ7_9ACTN|nr:hypothetical protein [Nonomuraea jabiensis]
MVLQPAMLVANHLSGVLRAGPNNLADTQTGPYADQITPATQAPGAASVMRLKFISLLWCRIQGLPRWRSRCLEWVRRTASS